jgi:hypothetical protein
VNDHPSTNWKDETSRQRPNRNMTHILRETNVPVM